MSGFGQRILLGLVFIFSALHASASNDEILRLRHESVTKARTTFAQEISDYKSKLGVSSDSIALLALAKNKLEKFEMLPSDPDWAVLIHNVLMGYGFDALPIAADVTTKETVAAARMYSAAYMQVLGGNPEVNLAALQGVSGVAAHDLENYVAQLNAYNSAITDDFRLQIAADAERLNSLKMLSTGNAWFAHERFWAVAGVLSPDAAINLKDAYATYKATGKTSAIEFLGTLTTQLNGMINSLAATPTVDGRTTRAMVYLAQQILLTITAGTPEDAAYARLVPANDSDWQNIRKALFLALSVSENPAHGGHTFLSTVYDLGRFYHIKTDADAVKEYYWRLEAYGNAFTSVWEGLSAAKTDAQISSDLTTEHAKFSNPLCRWLHGNITADSGGMTEQKCTSEPVYRRAYKSAFAGVTAASARGELAGVLSARAKLKYVEAFNEAYPTYTAWSEYHVHSNLVLESISGARISMAVPGGFKTAQIKLDYQAGKWALKALAADGREHILWSQASTAKEEFFGELQDKRGNHLYRFGVDGTKATINTISSGYEFAVNNNAATVVVVNGDKFGILDISAFPRDVDNWNEEDNVITIKACKFIGQKGLISARRGGVWLEGQEIALGNKKSVKKRHSNGCEYDHFSAGGQVIGANRFVTILFPKVDISGASLYSQQMVQVVADDYIWSLASITDAPYLFFYAGDWHPDVQVTYAGIPGVDPYVSVNLTGNPAEFNRRQAALTPNHDQTVLSYGRNFHYFVGSLFTVNSAEFKALFAAPHGYGRYFGKQTTCPTFTAYTTVTVVQASGGGRRGGSGFGGMGGFGSGGGFGSSGFSGFGQHGNLGGSALASMAAASVHVSAADFSVSNRGGNVNVGGSMTLSSMLGSTTTEFASSHGAGGSTTALYSIFTPPSLAQAAAVANATGRDITAMPPQANPLLMLHGFNAQGIALLTQPRGTHASQVLKPLFAASLREAAHVGARAIGVLKTGQLAKEALEEAREKVQAEEGAAAATGGGGDDKDPEKKKPYKIDDDNADPSLPVGHRQPGKKTPSFQTKNESTKIGDRDFCGHALDEMRSQGITPSVVEDAIRTGERFPGRVNDRVVCYSRDNNVSVIIETDGTVVTASIGKLHGVQ